MDAERTGFWMRVVADAEFADAVIDDPLRALSGVTDVDVSTPQVHQLEEMTRDERSEFIRGIVREAFLKGAIARYGQLAEEGLLGAGGPLPPELRADQDDDGGSGEDAGGRPDDDGR